MTALIYGMIYAGSALMVYNIIGFIRFKRYVSKLKSWKSENGVLYIPIVLLLLFLAGYLLVGILGKPDLIMAGILFGGSIFVFIMYKFLNGITRRIVENEKLEAELAAAEESSRTKTEFLSGISHEMRTPMNAILGISAIAQKNPDISGETREQLKKIERSGRHLLELINNILDLNRIESGEIGVRREEFSLTEIIGQIDAIVGSRSEEKGIVYESRWGEDVLGRYCGDEMLLKQILLAILDNAVKYTDAPGKITVSTTCIAKKETVRVMEISVSDTGVGIAPEFLDKIFELFAREDASTTSRYGGSGLGLSAAQRKVTLLGGSIRVQSRKNTGSVFTVTLPLQYVGPEETARDREEETESLENRRILIVEDIEENAEIVADLLELEGAESERAENGQIALDLFDKSEEGYYDAVLMDLRMPVMDGIEAARRIRELNRPDAKKIPILALTANALESDVEQTMNAGMNAHLVKPVDSDRLYDTLKQTIQQNETEGGES